MSHYANIQTFYQLLTNELTSNRPTIENIYPNIFTDGGPRTQQVVEISGNTSTGKTFLITEIIANCLLPQSIDDAQIGGKNSGAILINTDHHFHIFKLITVMKNLMNKTNLSSQRINDTIKKSLSNLIVLNCFDSQQLYLTFHNLEKILIENVISLVVVDSLNAYYWTDRLIGGIKKMDLHKKTVLKVLQNMTKDYKTVIIYTKSNNKEDNVLECVQTPTLEKINYKISLEQTSDKEKPFVANIILPNNTTVKKYYELSDVIKWL